MSEYIASVGSNPLKPVLFVAIVTAFVLIGIETWTRVGAPGPTSAVAGSIDPSAMMANASNLAISKPDDYSLVFHRADDSSSGRKSPTAGGVRSGHSGPKSSLNNKSQ